MKGLFKTLSVAKAHEVLLRSWGHDSEILLIAADERASISGRSSNSSLANAKAILVIFCGMNSDRMDRQGTEIELRRPLSKHASVEKDHAVIARSCAKKAEMVGIDADESASRRGACIMPRVAKAHAMFAIC